MKRWLLLPLIVAVSFLVSCFEDLDPPVLSVVPIDLSTVTSFYVFGEEYKPGHKSSNFAYYLNASNVQVRASAPGTVEKCALNPGTPDYEIFVRYSDPWFVQYDHVLNPTVAVGDRVFAGDVLGTVGTGNLIEVGIDNNYEGLCYCPFDFATESFINQHKALAAVWCLEATVDPFP